MPLISNQQKAILYVRVSSKEQEKEGYSLDAQEKLGREYAHRSNLEIVRLWKVSESAWKQERKAFGQLIEYSKRHPEIEHIIFDITDRMTRNDFDKLKIYTLIKDYGKTIHFSRTNKTINRESGSDDEFMFDIEVAVAKKMSNDISRKAKMGMQEKAEQGEFPSAAPIGYINNKQTHSIEVDPDRAPAIRRAFIDMASGNYSLNTLGEKLFKEGLRSKKNLRIIKPTLGKILNNPFYYGSFLWKGKLYQGVHEPIISKQQYDQVQFILSGKGHSFHASKKSFAFNSLLRCGVCGCKVLGELKKKKYTYYHCTFSKGRHHRQRGYIRENKLASLFEDTVRTVTITSEEVDWIKELLHESIDEQKSHQEHRIVSLKRQKSKLQNRLSNLYDLRVDNVFDNEIFIKKENEYKSDLFEVEAMITQSMDLNHNFYEDGCKILELSNRLFPLYLRSDVEEKAGILRSIASNYTLNDLSICPTYKKPFSFIAEGNQNKKWRG